MAAEVPIRIQVCDKTFQHIGWIGTPLNVSLTKRRNAPGDCTFTVSADHRRVPDLMTSGTRCVVSYRYADDAPWQQMISGRVQNRAGEGSDGKATRTFQIRDDWNILHATTGWPNPANPIDQQSDQAYYTITGPAETVALDVIRKNYVTRLGQPLTVPTSLGRGSNVSLKFRMDYLADILFPAVDDAGIILEVGQNGDHREVTVRQPATYPHKLTEGSGVVVNGSFSEDEITATRVIVGVGGSDTARIFRQFTNTAAEAALGEPLEVFVDASSVALTDDITAESQKQADQAFTDNGVKIDLNLELIEAGAFRFGKAFQVGDNVTVQLAGGAEFTDYVRDVEITWTTGDGGGLKVVPHVGNWQQSADAQLDIEVARLGKFVRSLQRR